VACKKYKIRPGFAAAKSRVNRKLWIYNVYICGQTKQRCMRLSEVQLIQLPKIPDERGNLSFFENESQIPFTIARTYWIYDVPGGQTRGGHAYKTLREFIVALSGSFDVVLNDGVEEKTYTLNRSNIGLFVPKMIWRHMENFATNSLALIAADKFYDEADYIRDIDTFKQLKNG
jgi:dTDP-4-dehydrorhamnose 3,5-epimerase-like enzyme